MSRALKVPLLLAAALVLLSSTAALVLLSSIALAQESKPVFTAKDRELIEGYYNHLIGTLAPGSLDRSPFPLGIEKILIAGSHVPMQLEKDLQPLPAKLESQLSPITGDYGRYKLGRHVVIVKKADLAITDILKNVAVKETPK
jgi:hypothetical protein